MGMRCGWGDDAQSDYILLIANEAEVLLKKTNVYWPLEFLFHEVPVEVFSHFSIGLFFSHRQILYTLTLVFPLSLETLDESSIP